MWKNIRILCLLIILLVVAVNAWRDQNQNWDQAVVVLVHPINADGRDTTQRYIEQLKEQDFKVARQYLEEQAKIYRAPIFVLFKQGRTLQNAPPAVPTSGSLIDSVLWSLKFRFYAWKQHQSEDGVATVTLYVNYFDPKLTKTLKHSTALEKGRIGSVNLFAASAYHQSNQVVLVHELLHAFGASDKYDLATGRPIYPIGYAEPDLKPLYPQRKAELMAGHIAISEQQSQMPKSLRSTQINDLTALEIGWKK